MRKVSALLILKFCTLAALEMQASFFEAPSLDNSRAGFFAHKNVERIEKGSSFLAFVLTYSAMESSVMSGKGPVLWKVALGMLAINATSNVALGCGYKKDKKALGWALIPITLMVLDRLFSYGYIKSDMYHPRLMLIGILSTLMVKECCDLYSVVKSYNNISSNRSRS